MMLLYFGVNRPAPTLEVSVSTSSESLLFLATSCELTTCRRHEISPLSMVQKKQKHNTDTTLLLIMTSPRSDRSNKGKLEALTQEDVAALDDAVALVQYDAGEIFKIYFGQEKEKESSQLQLSLCSTSFLMNNGAIIRSRKYCGTCSP